MTHVTADATAPHPDCLSASAPPPRSSRGLVVLVSGLLALVALALLAGVLTSGMLTLGASADTADPAPQRASAVTALTATVGGAHR